MESNPSEKPGFFARIGLAFRILFDAELAAKAVAAPVEVKQTLAKPAAMPPERQHASALHLLAALQREGRLLDFLQQEIAGFSDEDIGAGARVVHAGCRKVLAQSFEITPIAPEQEGASTTVQRGFDAQRIRLTGNVTGELPYKGTVKHHGWIAREIRLPAVQESMDPRVLAPAEVEL